jgi:hypothetical protein
LDDVFAEGVEMLQKVFRLLGFLKGFVERLLAVGDQLVKLVADLGFNGRNS